MSEQRYVALVPGLRFGEDVLAVGDPVPHEPGRNYRGMLQRREIGPAPAAGSAPADQVDPAVVDLATLTWEELRSLLDEHGPELPAELVDLREHGVTLDAFLEAVSAQGEPRVETVTLDEAGLRELVRTHGFDLVPLEPASQHPEIQPAEPEGSPPAEGGSPAPPAPVVEIPSPLPSAKAELEQLVAQIGLEVKGTGSKGYVKESDLAAALEAERQRRAAAEA